MKTQHKKQKSKQKTKSNPREEVIRWVKEFVEVPHPMFADYPPCPYAKQARMQGKVDFRELTDMEPDSNIWTSIDHFDFEKKDVLLIIAYAKRWTPHYTQKLAAQVGVREPGVVVPGVLVQILVLLLNYVFGAMITLERI